ncbi:UNVERIFIED_CONTAM: hypothetical protein Slati_3847400 [Sesamum latifolium]|uniref:Uncharacterized protein n=1 Tax=Sesamum latifolium TaxID=2727402 RepID=A0AAW2TKJ7_9LAMI
MDRGASFRPLGRSPWGCRGWVFPLGLLEAKVPLGARDEGVAADHPPRLLEA